MMRLSAIALWTRGRLLGEDVDVTGVAIDTRKLQPGDLFVAIKGERVDGHDFLADAKARGAIAALVTRKVDFDLPQVLVDDTELALGDLASAVRAGFQQAVRQGHGPIANLFRHLGDFVFHYSFRFCRLCGLGCKIGRAHV